jgi:hypothetical protein
VLRTALVKVPKCYRQLPQTTSTMKNRLQILFIFISVITFGQKTLNDFEGTLLFKDVNFYMPLTREITDTTINYYSFNISSKNKGSEIEIEQLYFKKNDYEEYYFVKFKFIKRHDSLFISYLDPLKTLNVFDYIYPLNKRDTIANRVGYKICLDSTLNSDNKFRKTIEDCEEGPKFNSTYFKDTTITFKEYSFDCYIIEQNYNFFRNQTLSRKRIFIDKTSLIPVYEDEFVYAKRRARRVPLNKWVMTRQMKLINID